MYFTIYWTTGTKSFHRGEDIVQVIRSLGGSSLPLVIDHYQEGFNFRYTWNAEHRRWEFTTPEAPQGLAKDQLVDLYSIDVNGVSFNPQVTEGFLMDFISKFHHVSQPETGKLWVLVSDLPALFDLKFGS